MKYYTHNESKVIYAFIQEVAMMLLNYISKYLFVNGITAK